MEAMGGLVAGEFWLFSAPCQASRAQHVTMKRLETPCP